MTGQAIGLLTSMLNERCDLTGEDAYTEQQLAKEIMACAFPAPVPTTSERFCNTAANFNLTVNNDDGFVEEMTANGQTVQMPDTWNDWSAVERAAWIAATFGLDHTAGETAVYSDTNFSIGIRGGSFSNGVGQLFKVLRPSIAMVINGLDCSGIFECQTEIWGGCSLAEWLAIIGTTTEPVEGINKNQVAEATQDTDLNNDGVIGQ